ncbi:hypothetical protein OPT61_g4028 [Boeremia exigua]|uniref:Uncharacterized protein n=1 Tax=Boeremia exigua TaxID=749465 RepID=A0ACC2IFV9_9PLEO|nr:hypothetical protein OPT61_g4028 [Boeremia exigua]
MAVGTTTSASFRRKNRTLIAALSICTLFIYSCQRSEISVPATPEQHHKVAHKTVYCPQDPLTEDILVVLRTGATEVREKLPVHVDTTLRCIPHYVIYSDYAEDIGKNHVHDVFDELSPELKDSVPDFALYHRLQAHGREGLSSDGNGTQHHGSGPSGSLENPGWKLDKFKFLPMVDKALRHRPQAKWFVFVELDTYLMWGNLLEYLARFDSGKPYYIGKQMFIGEVLFAHGGSGFVLSAAAVRKVVAHWRAHMAEYNQYTIEQWAGDMVLGRALKDVEVPLVWAFPHFQGDPVSTLDHNITKIDRQPWCYPAITYHHMAQEDIQALWEFEQKWLRVHPAPVPVRHAEVFKGYVYPHLSMERTEWDNYSVDLGNGQVLDNEAHTSVEACRAACEKSAACLQFSFTPSTCLISNEVRLGKRSKVQCIEYSAAASKCEKAGETPVGVQEGGVGAVVRSGWMVDRLESYVIAMDQTCSGDLRWIV